jgi:anti-sigma B factor antagonist
VVLERGIPADVRTGEIALERTDAGLAVLTISGEHDLSTAPALRRRLEDLLEQRESIVVDLSPATFIDSTILGVILDARRRAEDDGLGFAVSHANGTDAVGRVLEITGLRAELPVHEAREAATVAAVNPAGKSAP